MNVLLTTDSFPPGGGGSGRSTAALARALSRRGHRVRVVVARPEPSGRRDGFGSRCCRGHDSGFEARQRTASASELSRAAWLSPRARKPGTWRTRSTGYPPSPPGAPFRVFRPSSPCATTGRSVSGPRGSPVTSPVRAAATRGGSPASGGIGPRSGPSPLCFRPSSDGSSRGERARSKARAP